MYIYTHKEIDCNSIKRTEKFNQLYKYLLLYKIKLILFFSLNCIFIIYNIKLILYMITYIYISRNN